MNTINERLAQILLIEKKLTASEIGRDIDESTTNVTNWLKGRGGKYVMPAADIVGKICSCYKLDVTYVLLGIVTKVEIQEIKYDTVENVSMLYRNEVEKARDLKDDILELKQDKADLKDRILELKQDKSNMQLTINGLLKSVNLLEK